MKTIFKTKKFILFVSLGLLSLGLCGLFGLSLLKHKSKASERTTASETEKNQALQFEKYWRQIDFFENPLFFVSKDNKKITASLNIEGKPSDLPTKSLIENKAQIKQWEKRKRQLLSRINTITDWTPQSYSLENNTLFVKGFFFRKEKKIFFKEWHFYSSDRLVQVLISSPVAFTQEEEKVKVFLQYVKNKYL